MRILFMAALLVLAATQTQPAQAGGPWSNQYCNIKTTHIKVVDIKGNVVEEKTEEKVNLMTGKKFTQSVNTPRSCDPSTELYWTM